MNQQSPEIRGFTILELIVSAFVVVVFISLILPAIHAARANARLSSCSNNLKQLGFAIHNYYDSYTTFPPGWISHTAYPQEKTSFGWHTLILPYVDQGPIYDQLTYEVAYGTDAFTTKKTDASMTPIKLYRCPDDVTEAFNTMREGFATSNYSGIHGSLPLPRWAPAGIDHFWPGTTITPITSNGIFFWNSKIRFRDITDGTSNTLMIGERSSLSGAGIWPGVRSNNTESDQVTTCAVGNEINSGLDSFFSSQHRNGAQFVMCDGVVRFISEDVSSFSDNTQPAKMGTFQRLGQRNDGLVVDSF